MRKDETRIAEKKSFTSEQPGTDPCVTSSLGARGCLPQFGEQGVRAAAARSAGLWRAASSTGIAPLRKRRFSTGSPRSPGREETRRWKAAAI
jgi:hypothetical protein